MIARHPHSTRLCASPHNSSLSQAPCLTPHLPISNVTLSRSRPHVRMPRCTLLRLALPCMRTRLPASSAGCVHACQPQVHCSQPQVQVAHTPGRTHPPHTPSSHPCCAHTPLYTHKTDLHTIGQQAHGGRGGGTGVAGPRGGAGRVGGGERDMLPPIAPAKRSSGGAGGADARETGGVGRGGEMERQTSGLSLCAADRSGARGPRTPSPPPVQDDRPPRPRR